MQLLQDTGMLTLSPINDRNTFTTVQVFSSYLLGYLLIFTEWFLCMKDNYFLNMFSFHQNGKTLKHISTYIVSAFSLVAVLKSLMAEWLEQTSQWHEMYCHDLVWFGLCCLMTPGLSKDIQRHVRPYFL